MGVSFPEQGSRAARGRPASPPCPRCVVHCRSPAATGASRATSGAAGVTSEWRPYGVEGAIPPVRRVQPRLRGFPRYDGRRHGAVRETPRRGCNPADAGVPGSHGARGEIHPVLVGSRWLSFGRVCSNAGARSPPVRRFAGVWAFHFLNRVPPCCVRATRSPGVTRCGSLPARDAIPRRGAAPSFQTQSRRGASLPLAGGYRRGGRDSRMATLRHGGGQSPRRGVQPSPEQRG